MTHAFDVSFASLNLYEEGVVHFRSRRFKEALDKWGEIVTLLEQNPSLASKDVHLKILDTYLEPWPSFKAGHDDIAADLLRRAKLLLTRPLQ